MKFSTGYVIMFAIAVCFVCAVFVAGAAVALKDRQEENRVLDKYEKVLSVAGLIKEDEDLSGAQIKERFAQSIEPKVLDLRTGDWATHVDPTTFDMQRAMKDPQTSEVAPPNDAKVTRLPHYGVVYQVKDGDKVSQVVLPIEGKGLWSTLFGYFAVDADGQTVRGITFYQHGETPGLGGEVDNPKWKKGWQGRQIFGPSGEVKVAVRKGQAGTPEQDPFGVDGLSGATITSRGVTNMLRFWMGPKAYGPFLEKLRNEQRRAL